MFFNKKRNLVFTQKLFSPRKKMVSTDIDRLEEIVKARRKRKDVPEEIDTTEIAKLFQTGMENRRLVMSAMF